ncbi:hypothetical protein [Staphylococcus hominis]|uniref:hypothetical protein n=1 Tax=Staphylococcus hominis TaxID=1290 RepID=UPI0016429A14
MSVLYELTTSEEIKDVGTYQHLGLRALSEIATLPEPERTFATKSMKISRELGSNVAPVQHLGVRALYQIATFSRPKKI